MMHKRVTQGTDGPTAMDWFCGMGGSSTGLVRAGYEVKVAANHWDRAIETHSANHPETEHLLGDIQAIDLRYLPKTDLLWASPICTEISPAGGRARKQQPDLFQEHGHVAAEAFERTRVTFWEVIRAAELHRYPIVLVENVAEAITDWELFPIWLAGMTTLGYEHQIVSVSAAHIGADWNPAAPQWRDRIYVVLNRRGVPKPDVTPRPLALCEHCGHDVNAVQWWKPGRTVGKYGSQYHFVCPELGHGIVEPYVAPASAAINWDDLGARIGDRPRPLAPRTLAKVKAGLAMSERAVFSMAHGGRAAPFDPDARPMAVHTTAQTEGLALSDSFVAMLRKNGKTPPVTDPLPAFTAGGYHHGLVIPFRRGSKPYPASVAPLSTMATRDQHGVMRPATNLEDSHFRMLTPREAANAQAFPRDYIMLGNAGERQKQAGNAVPTNVAAWLGAAARVALDSRAAA